MSEHQETAEHAEAAEHAKPARAGDEKPEVATRPVPPKHPSRQSLVVKPRSSGGPLFVFGAIVSAAAGFAVVFATGLGRSPDADPSDARAVAEAPKVDATRTIEPPQGAVPTPQAPRFFVPAGDDQLGDAEPAPLDERPRSRFAATPVALEDSAGSGAASDAPPVGSSRFADAVPPANPVDAAEEPAPLLVPADDELPVAEAAKPRGAEPSQVAEEQEKTGETVADADAGLANATPTPPPTLPTATAATPSPTTPPATTVPPPTPLPAATDDDPPPIAAAPSPAGAATPSGLRAPPLESTFAAALAPMQPPASKNPVAPAGAPFEDHEAPIPVTPPGGGPSGPPAGRTTPDLAQPDRPPQDRFASTDATRGFGGAPTVTPPPTGGVPPSAQAGEPDHDAGAGPLASAAPGGPVQADGRPGPIQLEGIQTPQLTIEKRGPREVQVGKVARYDMVVRNVGGVSAHDVTLRDRVPLGTKLVSTSPPAAPGDAGELVWTLGSLPQGGQARVAMEVMPTEEGEVGSVASVSFRADASVRSVATRAGLAIEAENPKAVLVGSAVDLAITVRNPGTGEATGVVLEGNVPSGFTHASGSALEYDVGRLKPGETRRIDLKLVSTHPGVQSLKLSARADGRIETDHAVRLEVTAPTLELAANMPSRRYLQRPVTCVLSMNNAGTAPANTIELAAQLPPGMKFLRANNAGYYEESTHRVLWHLEQLPAAEVGSVEMVLVPTALGPQRIAAAARSADGLAAQVTHTVEVEGLAALLFEVGDSEDPIEVDGITEYVVRVGNQGTKAATGVRVTATLLGDLEPVDAKGPAAHRIENLSILFEPLATLAPAEESVYRIRVRGRRAGDQRVQVQVTSDDSQSPITKEEVTRVYADR